MHSLSFPVQSTEYVLYAALAYTHTSRSCIHLECSRIGRPMRWAGLDVSDASLNWLNRCKYGLPLPHIFGTSKFGPPTPTSKASDVSMTPYPLVQFNDWAQAFDGPHNATPKTGFPPSISCQLLATVTCSRANEARIHWIRLHPAPALWT